MDVCCGLNVIFFRIMHLNTKLPVGGAVRTAEATCLVSVIKHPDKRNLFCLTIQGSGHSDGEAMVAGV